MKKAYLVLAAPLELPKQEIQCKAPALTPGMVKKHVEVGNNNPGIRGSKLRVNRSCGGAIKRVKSRFDPLFRFLTRFQGVRNLSGFKVFYCLASRNDLA